MCFMLMIPNIKNKLCFECKKQNSLSAPQDPFVASNFFPFAPVVDTPSVIAHFHGK